MPTFGDGKSHRGQRYAKISKVDLKFLENQPFFKSSIIIAPLSLLAPLTLLIVNINTSAYWTSPSPPLPPHICVSSPPCWGAVGASPSWDQHETGGGLVKEEEREGFGDEEPRGL